MDLEKTKVDCSWEKNGFEEGRGRLREKDGCSLEGRGLGKS